MKYIQKDFRKLKSLNVESIYYIKFSKRFRLKLSQNRLFQTNDIEILFDRVKIIMRAADFNSYTILDLEQIMSTMGVYFLIMITVSR